LWQPGTEPQSPILLEPEQGLGDTIQFIRFIPELARRGHRVWLGCPKPLRTLLEGFPGVERLLTNTAEAAGAGCRLPLMSLPSRLGITDLSEFSAPYLKAPQPQTDSPTEAAHHTRARRRIGFVWRGNPQHKNDHRRSSPILEFANTYRPTIPIGSACRWVEMLQENSIGCEPISKPLQQHSDPQ